MSKLSTFPHFPLEPGCEEYSLLDHAVDDFKRGLDSILLNSIDMPEIDASCDETNALPSSVSSGFLYSVRTVSDSSRLQLPPSIKSPKLWCQARPLLLPAPQAGKTSASKLIHYLHSSSCILILAFFAT